VVILAKDLERVAAHVAAATQSSLSKAPDARVGGGSINASFRWRGERGPLFVKIAPANGLEMFEAEAAGLEELGAADAVRVPRVLALGADDRHAFIALEWLDLRAPSARSEAQLGIRLARQHRVMSPQFGWHRDGTIGATHQDNTLTGDWLAFLRDRRLGAQFSLAQRNGHHRLAERGARLLAVLDAFFSDYQPVPALLHGDLWSGNRAADENDLPVIFDPAVYYGDRETDIAMTKLFGGFGEEFYSAYDTEQPRARGASTRALLYNLYHVLNHLNMFGDAYLRQSSAIIDQLLAEQGC
jgi:protein-ribulosamine 3-kinase